MLCFQKRTYCGVTWGAKPATGHVALALCSIYMHTVELRIDKTILDSISRSGLDKSFSNVVARRASIDPYLVARPKKWLPKNFDR